MGGRAVFKNMGRTQQANSLVLSFNSFISWSMRHQEETVKNHIGYFSGTEIATDLWKLFPFSPIVNSFGFNPLLLQP